MQQIIRLIIASLIFVILPARAEQLAGEVTAALGEAQIVASVGDKRTAVQGMQLHVGDILQTGTGGHMHIRMIDDALVSLRPNSKLKIASYTYKPGVTATTQIRLDLLYGTVRSVTGKGGELAKDRFRMNTPLAAIGVRGTDFIAKADAEKTLVNVASGAIVLAPFGAGCLENTLGVCQTAGARVLTAEMRDMMLELNRGMTEPRLVPLGNKLQINDPQAAGSAKPQIPLQTSANTSAQVSTQASAQVSAQVAVDTSWQIKTLDSLAATPTAPAAAPAPAAPAGPAPLSHYQMVWGNWPWVTPSAISVSYSDAAQGREVTVGNANVGLFRDDSTPILLPSSGNADFSLRASEVTLPQANGTITGQVQSGSLGVNFNARTFNTQLNMQTPVTGAVVLNAAGTVGSDGMFFSTPASSNGTVAGSLSRNAAEAGYLFNLPTTAGTLSGTTLWIR